MKGVYMKKILYAVISSLLLLSLLGCEKRSEQVATINSAPIETLDFNGFSKVVELHKGKVVLVGTGLVGMSMAYSLLNTGGIDELVKMIPAKTEKVMQLCKEQNIQKANAAICYNTGEDITRAQAKKAKSMFFLGTFDFQADEIESVSTSLAGLRNLTWAGITHKSKDEFMQYFNQDEDLEELRKFNNGETKKRPSPMLRCQFCKDLGINFYYPEFLYIEFADNIIEAKELVRRVIKDEFLYDVVDFTLEKQKIRMANCAFCYIPNGFRDKKKDQKIFIFKKELFSSGNKPKNYIEELDNYNGLTFLGGFMWD